MDKFIADREEKLTKAVGKKLPSVSFTYLQKLFRKKDIKVNGKRISKDIALAVGDEVVLYTEETKLYHYEPEIVYSDDNIFVVFKKKGMPSVGENSMEEKLRDYFSDEKICVAHRLDTNTDGLQLVAKSQRVFEALAKAFKTGSIEKKYVAVVAGALDGRATLKGYLVKNSDESRVYVSKKPMEGALTIVTEYNAIAAYEGATKLEITLKTGRTHQIRAHMQSIGYPIIGDSKYGDSAVNEKFREKTQALRAYYLKINIKSGFLSYLDGKVFTADGILAVEKKLVQF